MRDRIRGFVKEERGSVVVLVSLFMVVLLGMMALVVDVGIAYAERVKLQNAVDAAALAGAARLSLHQPAARNQARFYAERNGVVDGVEGKELKIEFPDNDSIQVSAKKPVASFFAGILTDERKYIQVQAKAKIRGKTGDEIGRVVPFVIKDRSSFCYGWTYRLKTADVTDHCRFEEDCFRVTGRHYWKVKDNRYSWYGALNLGSGWCGYEYRQFIRGRRDNENQTLEALGLIEVNIGDNVNIKKGVQCWYTDEGVRQRIFDACDDSTFYNHASDCLRLIIMPVFKEATGLARWEQRGTVEITGFALFYLVSRESVGRGGYARSGEAFGRFVQMITPELVWLDG